MNVTEIKNELANTTKIDKLVKNIGYLSTLIIDGEVEPIEPIVSMRRIKSAIERVEKNDLVTDAVLQELYKWGKNVQIFGAKIQVKEVGTTYDFSACQDPIWNFINCQIKELQAKMKDREAMLKSLKKTETMVNDETGEIYTIYPPVKKSKTGYSVTL